MITAVIFDVGEVIFTGMKDIERALARHLSLTPKIISEAMRGSHQAAVFRGKITEDEYWQAFLQRIDRRCPVSELKVLSQELVSEVPGTRAIIQSLRDQYFQLGLLSVHVREWVRYCDERFHFQRLFDVRQYSYEVGLCKPDPLVYQKILADLKCQPGNAVFIDDRARNVAAAQTLGMHGLVFQNSKKLRTDLATLNIVI